LLTPCDTPNLDRAGLQRLVEAWQETPQRAVAAWDGEAIQPLVCLLATGWLSTLRRLIDRGERRARLLVAACEPTPVTLENASDTLVNLNTPADAARWAQRQTPTGR
jgi:molybdopterin-guanine dinucleotide biosynthesis protein A